MRAFCIETDSTFLRIKIIYLRGGKTKPSSHTEYSAAALWWEVHLTGASSIHLTGYRKLQTQSRIFRGRLQNICRLPERKKILPPIGKTRKVSWGKVSFRRAVNWIKFRGSWIMKKYFTLSGIFRAGRTTSRQRNILRLPRENLQFSEYSKVNIDFLRWLLIFVYVFVYV